MKDTRSFSPFKICPKTGRIAGVQFPRQLPLVLLPAAGFLALVWFLIRVVPKPSRATYPCQRVAAPLASSFLMWLAGVTGATLAFRHAQVRLRQARYAAAALALIVALAGIAWGFLSQGQPVQALPAAYTPHPANAPIGVARGLAPGRVSWVHNPVVTDWDGVTSTVGQRWFDRIDQAEATKMMQWAVMSYAGTTTTAAAWDAIFQHFNGGAGYASGEKIFIKINLTTSNAPNCADSSYNWNPSSCGANWTSIGQSPQLMIALLDQLVNAAGVAQADIAIGDPTGLWVNELYDPVHGAFPGEVYLDARGGSGRTKAISSTTPLYWSAPAAEIEGKSQDYLLQAVADARYVINLAILKSHERAGITAAAKNHFGSLYGATGMRKPTTTGYYNLHSRLPLETTAPPPTGEDRREMALYRPLVDLNGHEGMGGKTLFYILDAIYAGKGWNGAPSKWSVPPFCSTPGCDTGSAWWPASLLLSMDPVAIDSVAFDFLSLRTDWTEVLAAEGVQDYLHEMALANNPPSGTFYDPEGDGTAMASQGVHEHWNDAAHRQYSRNTGAAGGIDLLYVTGDPTGNAAVRRTEQPIVIDGALDTAWDATPGQAIDNVLFGGGVIGGSEDLSASYRTLYDGTDLYVLVEVADDALVNDSTSPDDDDCVVLLIDGDYSRGASYDGTNDFDLGFCWSETAVTVGASSAPIPSGAAFQILQTVEGYRVEIRVPLDEIGVTPGYGGLFGLDVHVNDDDDDGQGDAEIAWWASVDADPQAPNGFGAARLEGPQEVNVIAAPGEEGVLLEWAHFAWNDAYEIHRSASPYFEPDATTLVDEVPAPESQYPDAASIGTTYYVVRARQSGLGIPSNRTGRFQFDLTAP